MLLRVFFLLVATAGHVNIQEDVVSEELGLLLGYLSQLSVSHVFEGDIRVLSI